MNSFFFGTTDTVEECCEIIFGNPALFGWQWFGDDEEGYCLSYSDSMGDYNDLCGTIDMTAYVGDDTQKGRVIGNTPCGHIDKFQ